MLEETNDPQLVQLVQQGCKQAFDEIINRYDQRLYQTAMVILEDQCEARKITEESFQHAKQTLHEFKDECLLLTWLCRILINKANQKYREKLQQQPKNTQQSYNLPRTSFSCGIYTPPCPFLYT